MKLVRNIYLNSEHKAYFSDCKLINKFYLNLHIKIIGRKCLNGNQSVEILYKPIPIIVEWVPKGKYVPLVSTILGMSYDWISELLFLLVGSSPFKIKIEALSTSFTKPRMRTTIIENINSPGGIAVHPVAGYLFWTDRSYIKKSINRANLNGEDIRILFTTEDIEMGIPAGIAIDFETNRIYWTDSGIGYVGSSDLNGKSFTKKVLEFGSRTILADVVAINGHLMYFNKSPTDDCEVETDSVFSADKESESMNEICILHGNMTTIFDIKAYGYSKQTGTNECENSNKCSHFCIGAPMKMYSCLCPDGMTMSKNGECLSSVRMQ